MFCDKCGCELADTAAFCSNCGNKVKSQKTKNIYVALILTFLLTGLGSIYAGNVKKGLILLAARLLFAVLSLFIGIFFIFSVLVWVYGFYETYKDVQIANGHQNPKLTDDFKNWNQNRKIIAVLIICIVLIIAVSGSLSYLLTDNYSPDSGNTHYSTASSGSSDSSGSSHYGGVDTSQGSIARNDPNWYYDHYEYGDNPDIDDYLESEGYD